MLQQALTGILTILLTASAVSAADEPRLERFEFIQVHMGMPFRLALYAPSEEAANAGAKAAFARIKQLNAIMSDYEPDSELMRLCKTAGSGQAVPIGPDLQVVFARSLELSRRSDGAFDITVGPSVRLWRKARRTRKSLTPDQLAAARKLVGMQYVRFDAKAGTVELLKPGMQLDLGGIAAGYAVDEALQVLRKHGITSAMIDGSGDIGVSEAPPGTDGWRIGVAPLDPEGEPSHHLLLSNAAVTTSGDAWQFVELDGQRYSHIMNPKTGLGLTERSSVTVIARDCTTADSFATAVCVLGPDKGLKLIEDTPGAAAIIVRALPVAVPPAVPLNESNMKSEVETFVSTRVKDYTEPRTVDATSNK